MRTSSMSPTKSDASGPIWLPDDGLTAEMGSAVSLGHERSVDIEFYKPTSENGGNMVPSSVAMSCGACDLSERSGPTDW